MKGRLPASCRPFILLRSDCRVPGVHPEGAGGFFAADLVDVEAGERGRVEVECDEVLPADVGVAELVYVGDVSARHVAGHPLASRLVAKPLGLAHLEKRLPHHAAQHAHHAERAGVVVDGCTLSRDRKSTRLNSSHTVISYAVFCLKKKKKKILKQNTYEKKKITSTK